MKNRNFVNLNVNPCKMCMPMGAVLAMKGIENSMVILHGSQGCSTYIRRHISGHYNEPIDIASSSLNEEGTVYGGENNLKKGLDNIIKVYQPKIIGVATTCLAETIGEDIRRITSEYIRDTKTQIRIVPIQTPGYGGTQNEGYFAALRALVEQLAVTSRLNNKINIVASMMSPADVRNIKGMMDAMGIEYILLPDISDTLDAPYKKDFRNIPEGGTKIEDIEDMAGALATLEIGMTVPDSVSPGKYLEETFGVPLYRCSIPIGIQLTDRFLELLKSISCKQVPEGILKERGRLLDGMIDSHKHAAEGRVVIYGEPELVYSAAVFCSENGIEPVLLATGNERGKLPDLLDYLASDSDIKPVIIDDSDFETIEKQALELTANILLGNSDGKFITERHGIPLVRYGFPIHDRMGGQRLMYTGYTGSLKLLDDLVNTLLDRKYSNYRKDMYNRYYKEESYNKEEIQKKSLDTEKAKLNMKTKNHPCFTVGACENARMHLPIAPKCNIACNYCNRKYDCVNESRPGVTSEILSPEEAAEKFLLVKNKLPNLKVVGIAGPGDALANFKQVKKTVELISKLNPDITFCLSTNGLMLPKYAKDIVSLGIRHVTITINAIAPEIGAKMYGSVVYEGRMLKGREAASILINNQLLGLKKLASSGVVCKVNIVMVKGINDTHIERVVKKVKELGAYMTNIMPLIPTAGTVFENMPKPDTKELNELRKKCGEDLMQMYHCRQCRADAIGLLDKDISAEFRGCCSESKSQETPEKHKRIAVASKTGVIVDEHFGHAEELLIYDYENGKVKYIEKRKLHKYCTGAEECDNEKSKIESLLKAVYDCSAVLVLRIGYSPAKLLEEKGIRSFQTCGSIEEEIIKAAEEIEKASDAFETVGSVKGAVV